MNNDRLGMTARVSGRLGFGVSSRIGPGVDRLATRVEELGYDEVWTNHTRAGSGFEILAEGARSTRRIDLGIGVVGLSESDAPSIVEDVERLRLPLDRLILGIGSGSSSSVDLVRDGALALRRSLPDVRLAVAAVGPRMCRLAGELADVVLLNWNTPDRVAWSRERVAEGAADAGRATPRIAAYVRVSIGPGAEARLAREAENYKRSSAAYRRGFEEQRIDLSAIGIAAESPDDVPALLARYRDVLDSTIARGLPASQDVEAWIEIAEAAAPGA